MPSRHHGNRGARARTWQCTAVLAAACAQQGGQWGNLLAFILRSCCCFK